MTLHRRQLPGFFPHPHLHSHHTHPGKTAPIKAGDGGNNGGGKPKDQKPKAKPHASKKPASHQQQQPSHPAQAQQTTQRAVLGQPQQTTQRAVLGQPQHMSAPPHSDPPAQPQPTQQAPEPSSGIPSGAVVVTKLLTKSQTFSGKPAGYLTGDQTSTAPTHHSTHAVGIPMHHSGSMSKMATMASITALSSSAHFTSPTDVPVSSPSPSATSSGSSSGMSTGAKVGIAVGVIVAVALLIGLIVFAVRRRMSDDDDDRKKLADEKAPFGGPVPAFAGGAIGNSSPAMSEKSTSPSGTGFSGPTAAGAAGRGIPPVAQNTYEMATRENVPTRDVANDPSNPFGNHAEMVAASATASATAAAAAASPRKPVPGAASLSPKPLSVRSAHSGRSSTEQAPRNPPSRTGSPAVNGAAMAGPRSGPPGPRGPPPGPNNVHRVQLDFKPSMEDELELRAGQVVRLLHEYDDGWALCVRLDKSQQGVVPRTCLSKHPVRPRPPPGMRPGQGPPRAGSPAMSNYSGRSSPAMMDGARRPGPGPAPGMGRPRANSNSPYAGGPPRSMSPSPRVAEPQYDQRRRSNSTSNIMPNRRMSPPQNGPMNPSPFNPQASAGPSRKPVAGQAL